MTIWICMAAYSTLWLLRPRWWSTTPSGSTMLTKYALLVTSLIKKTIPLIEIKQKKMKIDLKEKKYIDVQGLNCKQEETTSAMTLLLCTNIWIRLRNCGCLVTWFCYQLLAKPGNKTATVPWPDPYAIKTKNIQLPWKKNSSGKDFPWVMLCEASQRMSDVPASLLV